MLPSNTLALINAAIGPSPNIIWVSISWTAGFAIGFTLVGRISDIFGRHWALQLSLLFFAIGSAVSTGSQNMATMLAGRGIAGIGAAGLLAVSSPVCYMRHLV